MQELIRDYILKSIKLKEEVVRVLLTQIEKVAILFINTIKSKRTIYFFGNGGSAADAEHFATELVGRLFKFNHPPASAIALTTNTALLTAISNDMGFENIFSRQLEALARPGDLAMGITTSGNSLDVLKGLIKARDLGVQTVALTGGNGGEVIKIATTSIVVPSYFTPHIQEVHIMIGHILCEMVERSVFGKRGDEF